MGGYAIFTFDKLKSSSEMGSRYKHNFRIYEDIANVDYRKTDENIEYISLNGKTYEEASREEILRMRISGIDQKIRKDAVLGYEIFMGYSHDVENIPIKRWAEKCIDWLERTFNPEDREIRFCDKEGTETVVRSDNVKSAVLHMDESTPHIHAFVVPIDERGHLNAKRFTGARDSLIQLQTSYAREMAEFGLKRGMERSNATASDISRYHSYLKQTVSATLPEPYIGESVNDYWKRANEELQKEKARHRNEILSLEQKIREISSERAEAIEWLAGTYSESGKQLIALARESGLDEIDDDAVRMISQGFKEHADFIKALRDYPDRQEAEQMTEGYMRLLGWMRDREREGLDRKERE